MHLNNREEGANGGGKTKRPSIGSMTQSTKINQIILLEDKEKILSAQLQLKRLHYQDEMVSNYLEMARERFEHDRELKKLQDVEMMKKAEQRNSMAGNAENNNVTFKVIKCMFLFNQYVCPAIFKRLVSVPIP